MWRRPRERAGRPSGGAEDSERPILAVDVDGVVVLYGHDERSTGTIARLELIDGMVHCISETAGEHLRMLSEHYSLIWASGWEARANEYLPEILGLPALPHLGFDGSARFGSADWKLRPLEEYARGRAVAWIDDNFDPSCEEWARRRREPTLLVPTESHLGLGEAQAETLRAWALGLP